MHAHEIEAWCRSGNGGTIGRTLLLPLSHPQLWEPGPLPGELEGEEPLPGRPLRAARKVRSVAGLEIAIGFALLGEWPDDPFAHAFNVHRGKAVDLALAGREVRGYWAYLPTAAQIAMDGKSLAVEAPSARDLREPSRAAG